MQSTSASPSSPVNQSTTTVAGAGGRSTVVSTLADVSSRALLLSGSLQHSSIQPPPSSPRKNHSGGNTIKEELAVPSPRSSGRHPTNEISSSSMRFFQEPPPPTATVRRTVAFAASHSRDEELQQLRIKKKQGKGGATGENDEGDDGTVLVRIHHKTGFTHVVVPAALAANASSSITGTASTASIDSATINDGDGRHATVSHQLSGDQNPDSPHHHPHPHHSHSHNRRSSAAVDKLRAFIRYKERKYDAINRLNRIGAFLVVFLFLNSVCRALGLSNESVYSITRHVAGVREGFGVFRNCENTAVFDTCHTWYDYPTSHIDARCHISNLHHKVNALWTFAIMDCACVGAALLMALITAFRPTRSKFHMAILCLCFLSVPFGIVTLVMYSHLVSCAKGQCAGIAECDEGFNWGFYVLIVAVISSFISGSFASSMRSYVFILKREANKESRMERRIRREQQEQWQRLQEQIDANNNNNANNNTNNEDAAMTDHHNIVFPLPLADDIGATREGGNSNAPFASASDDENGVVIETHRRVDGNDNSDDDDDDADEGDERRALLINRSRVRHQHRRVSSTNNAAAATNAAEISQSFRTDLRSPQADTPSAASSNIAAAIAAAGANAALTSHLQHHNSPSSSHNARNRRRSQGEFSLHSNSDNMSPSSSMRLEQQQQQQHNNNLSSLLSEQTPSASRGATPQQQSTPFEHAAGLWKEGEETPRGTMLASQQQHRNTGRQRGEHGRTRSAVLSSSTELNNNVASNHSAQAGGGRSGNSSPRGGQRPPPLRHKHSRSSGGAGGGGESGEQILNTTTSALNASSMRMSVTVGLIPPQYITAAEMGVEIAGSDDWVYAEQADMYYSFALEMFWDPINREYYNCRLGRWQEVM